MALLVKIAPLAAALAFAAGSALQARADDLRQGEEIVKAKCAACHATGKHGAPKIGDRAAWVPRMKNGLDAAVLAAIRGHGSMPARGGMAGLTDTEFRSAVAYLFNPAGPPPKPAPAPALGPNQRVVDGTRIMLGMKPMKGDRYYLSVTLRDAATDKVIDNAQVDVRVTNPVMGADAKRLAREASQGVVSYGNDFRVTGKEPHAIQVEVRLPGKPRPIETTFDFRG